jgi:hypothetical protein
MANYSKFSPYYSTKQNNLYLELLEIRPVPAEPDDYRYEIENQFKHRPDLLAYLVYGNAKLWWVFTQRNMDVLKDPIFDFVPGTVIYLPKKENLQRFLGV